MTGTPPPPGPRALLGEADRERLLVLLREHFARGQLELDEMSRRVGAVLAATYTEEAAAAVLDLPPLDLPPLDRPPLDRPPLGGAPPGGAPPSGRSPAGAARGRPGQRRRHAQRSEPGAGWVPTAERFRDPSTRAIVRVWVDPADLSRHYVPEPGG